LEDYNLDSAIVAVVEYRRSGGFAAVPLLNLRWSTIS